MQHDKTLNNMGDDIILDEKPCTSRIHREWKREDTITLIFR